MFFLQDASLLCSMDYSDEYLRPFKNLQYFRNYSISNVSIN